MSKELSERKKKILHALVDLYISTGQPVSSADIQSKYLPEVSSATIRAELSALEALGYIEQPHTSAGRVPLKDAYKFYVDSIDGSNASNMLTDQETEAACVSAAAIATAIATISFFILFSFSGRGTLSCAHSPLFVFTSSHDPLPRN